MRYLVLLRGLPGCGKSTFIQEKKLEPYTISSDQLRLMYESPILNTDGNLSISQSNDRLVWEQIHSLLEFKMGRGEFIVVDATHTTNKSIQAYKKLIEKHRYRTFVIDFSQVPLEVCKDRNKGREGYKIVPESVLESMHQNLTSQNVPSFATVISPEEFDETIAYHVPDYSPYPKIHIFGDIQGTATPLKRYFEQFPIQEDELYIFVGDYVDRGSENHLAVEMALELYTRPNFIFIEGNHEEYLWQWANDEQVGAKEFILRTQPQLEENKISKSKVREWLRRLRQLVLFRYGEKTVLVTHGGLSTLPENPLFISTRQLIKGAGVYNDVGKVDTAFCQNTNQNTYQIHGHRNAQSFATNCNERCFNLEGKVEFGGELRVVTLDASGFKVIEIPNGQKTESAGSREFEENQHFLDSLRSNPHIIEKSYSGNISSFNFSRKAFYDKIWNEQTIRARGLFVNTHTQEIVIRSFDKFFNLNERPETQYESLLKALVFPVKIWVKENGYLGLIGYNSQFDELVFASKTSLSSEFAAWLNTLFIQNVGVEHLEEIKTFLRDQQVSLVFEVMDSHLDPHIIEYALPRLVLLDIVKRQPDFESLGIEKTQNFARTYGLEFKKLAFELHSAQEFASWYQNVIHPDFRYDGEFLEGFVAEDAAGFMFKIKLHHYIFWKQMRDLTKQHLAGKEIKDFGRYLDSIRAREFYDFLREQPLDELENISIITLRKRFEKGDV